METKRDEQGTVSFLGLAVLMAVLTLGMGLLYAAKRHQAMVGGGIWEMRLNLAASGRLDVAAAEICADGKAAEQILSLNEEVCLYSGEAGGIKTEVYGRRTERGIFLLSLSQGREKLGRPHTHKRRQAYFPREEEATYVWGYFLP